MAFPRLPDKRSAELRWVDEFGAVEFELPRHDMGFKDGDDNAVAGGGWSEDATESEKVRCGADGLAWWPRSGEIWKREADGGQRAFGGEVEDDEFGHDHGVQCSGEER